MRIGRVIISKDKPVSAYSFWCTIENDTFFPEIGSYVVCETSFSGKKCRLLGIIESVKYTSELTSSAVYYSSKMPPSPPPVSPTIVRIAKVRLVASEMEVFTPQDLNAEVRTIEAHDADLLSKNIPGSNKILIGFAKGESSFVPVYIHSEYLLGEQAAHVNISGKTGLATKTSYALFLAYNILAWAEKNGKEVIIVMLNVKGGDLMKLHEGPSDWNDLLNKIANWSIMSGIPSDDVERILESWKKDLGTIDPTKYNHGVKYFTYSGDDFDPSQDKKYANVVHYSYGLGDITTEELIAALYRPYEEAEPKQINAIYTYMSESESQRVRDHLTFDNFLSDLRYYSTYSPTTSRQISQRPLVRLSNWHTLTYGALQRRVQGFLSQSGKIIERNTVKGNPIKFNSLERNKINIVQIYGLSDPEQRLVVNVLLREIRENLEKRSHMNVKVVVFVDELNKYAPKKYSPIKEQLLEIASRGRYIGLSLIGAQQFASKVDEEIYGNTSLKVVGQSDDAEIREDIYKFLGGLRKRVPKLKKGQLALYHTMLIAPIIIEFPPPIHVIGRVP